VERGVYSTNARVDINPPSSSTSAAQCERDSSHRSLAGRWPTQTPRPRPGSVTFTSVLINPATRGARRRATITATARDIADAKGEIAELDPAEAHLVRVVEYDVLDRAGNGTSELIVLLSTILSPAARPVPMSSPPPTTSAGTKRPPTTSSRPTYTAPGRSCARGYPSWCIRRSERGYWPITPSRP
jgi:hypothetical protein